MECDDKSFCRFDDQKGQLGQIKNIIMQYLQSMHLI